MRSCWLESGECSVDVDEAAYKSSGNGNWNVRSQAIWKGRWCLVLSFVVGVQEYDWTSTHDREMWRAFHTRKATKASKMGEPDPREGEQLSFRK